MNNHVPSPASSLASDIDAYNTEDARIHFGPLRSPEKKFHPIVAYPDTLHPPHSRSPLRRSPRLSTPCPPSPSPTVTGSSWKQRELNHVNVDEEIGSSEEVANLLYPETPEYDKFLQDEPSSVLATRIMKAHDNPSPPPGSSRSGFAGADYCRSVTPSGPPPPLSNDMTTDDQGLNPISVRSSPLAIGLREIQHSLLSFDSPLTSPSVTPPENSPPPSLSHLPIVNSHPSVDDLLSLSPGPGYPFAYNRTSRSASPYPLTPGPEQLRDLEGSRNVTCATTLESITSGNDGATLSLEKPSAGSPTIQSSHVLLIDDGLTESLRQVTVRGTATDDQRRHPLCTDEIENSPRSWKEDLATQEDHPLDDSASRSDSMAGPITKRSIRDTRLANRELGSLSPTSANLLTHLLSSPPKLVSGPVLDVTLNNVSAVPAIVEETDPLPPAQPPARFTQLPMTPTPDTPIRLISPIRFSSPIRSRGLQSPAKGRLQPAALDDPQRTPARRIPIEGASVSPHKEASFVGRIPVFKIPPTDSPARRVNVDQASAPWQGLRFGSPTRSTSPAKHRTAESHPSRMSSSKNKDAYGSQTMRDSSSKSRLAGSSLASSMLKPRPLPFPIMALGTGPPQSTLELKSTTGDAVDVRISSPVKSDSPPTSSPAKSSLKQTTSRIPRGIKPYARPPMHADKSTSATASRAKVRATPKSVGTLKRNGISSDDGIISSEPISTTHGKSAPTSMLKRKRGVEKASTLTKSRPVVLLRQVPRIAPSADAAQVSIPRPGVVCDIDVKESVQLIRRVPIVQSIRPIQQDSDSDALETPNDKVNDDTKTPKLQDIADKLRSSSPLDVQEQSVPLVTEPPTRRRTARLRKPTHPTAVADVFANAAPPQPRRRVNKTQSSGDGVFSGMSAVALKALTSSNTLRNQRYLAAKLETEVVRKPGARPESPAVKIKPTLQRQRDVKGKERKERADRRARMSDGKIGEGQSDTDRQSDIGDSSAADFDSDWDDQSSSPLRKRHKRAPGDEEDYETPLRTRVREEDEAEAAEKRRVKWDRGLFTTIYLDEVTVGARRPPKENIATKGCLAATAKAVPLDTLGNLPNANSPLTDLVEENVVVKKFVYDTDVEPVQEVIVVRNSRLRSKKGKD